MKPRIPNPRHGFTLVELLVTITIIAVLVGLVFTLAKKGLNRAQQAVCATNMGYVGQAIQAYAIENRNRLPGPLLTGQSAVVGPPRNLATFIAQYMELPGTPVNGKVVIQSFACPSWRKQVKSPYPEDAICYQVWGKLKLLNGKTVNPWTYNFPTATSPPPSRLDEFDPVAAGRTIALIEQDALLANAWGANSGPATPPHGNKRTALYFDWSVRGVPVPTP